MCLCLISWHLLLLSSFVAVATNYPLTAIILLAESSIDCTIVFLCYGSAMCPWLVDSAKKAAIHLSSFVDQSNGTVLSAMCSTVVPVGRLITFGVVKCRLKTLMMITAADQGVPLGAPWLRFCSGVPAG